LKQQQELRWLTVREFVAELLGIHGTSSHVCIHAFKLMSVQEFDEQLVGKPWCILSRGMYANSILINQTM
jgi:hypothetical protein